MSPPVIRSVEEFERVYGYPPHHVSLAEKMPRRSRRERILDGFAGVATAFGFAFGEVVDVAFDAADDALDWLLDRIP